MGASVILNNDSPKTIRKAVETVLQEKSYKKAADALSVSFRKQRGAAAAVDFIEKVINGN